MTHTEHGRDPHARHRDWDDAATWAKEIEQEPALVPATDALLDAVHAGPGQRLLDLACGLGQTTAAAAARGAHALGIDVSAKRIAVARARFPHARFDVADAAQPPAGPWDAVVCRFGAHHLSERWAEAAHAALVPGGRLAIAEWPPRDARDRDNGMRAAAHWEDALAAAGFENVRVDAVAPLPSARRAQAEAQPEDHRWLADRAVLIISGRKRG